MHATARFAFVVGDGHVDACDAVAVATLCLFLSFLWRHKLIVSHNSIVSDNSLYQSYARLFDKDSTERSSVF